MPQSSLLLTYDDIRQRVGQYRGYRMAIDDWTQDEKDLIEICLRDGSAMFYLQAGYEWSFLAPLATTTIASATTEVDLPWDFAFPVDECVYFTDNPGWTMRLVNDAQIYLKRQNDANSTGRPVFAAVVTEDRPGVKLGQQAKLLFWPESDAEYEVKFHYSILPNALAAITPMPYGGAAHSQTILEACLAASENLDGSPGPHNALYREALERSKQHDRRIKPRTLGRGSQRQRVTNIVTYVPGPNP